MERSVNESIFCIRVLLPGQENIRCSAIAVGDIVAEVGGGRGPPGGILYLLDDCLS